METKFEKTGPTTGRLEFTIDQETVNKGLDKTFKKVQKTLNVPGFRKGRVPRRIFNQMYGEAALYEDTLNDLLPAAYSQAIEDIEVEPVAQPDVDIKSVGKDQDWELVAELTLKPDVELGQYKDLDVVKQDREVSEEEVEESLEKRRQSLAELAIKEDAAELGDTVVIDYEGFKDGEAFEGGKGENYSLELGSNSFIPGFEEQLVGVKVDDEKEIELTFPEEYHSEDLAGQKVTFKVKVHEVKAKELPELDDDFAKDLDEDVETFNELKEKARKELEENKATTANDSRDDEAIRKAVENAKIEEIPHEMAHDEVHRQMEMFLNNLKQQGISADMYYQMTGSTEADLHKQFEGEAEFNVRTNLVLEEIVEKENLKATDEDIEKETSELAKQYNMDIEQVRNVLSPELLNRDISLKKAIDLITSTANEVLESKKDSDSE